MPALLNVLASCTQLQQLSLGSMYCASLQSKSRCSSQYIDNYFTEFGYRQLLRALDNNTTLTELDCYSANFVSEIALVAFVSLMQLCDSPLCLVFGCERDTYLKFEALLAHNKVPANRMCT